MEASSREALTQAREHLARRTSGRTAAGGQDLLVLADELFAVARLLHAQPTLRRALSDPSGKPEERAGVVRRLLASRLSTAGLELMETVARQRWSRPFDLVEALTALATETSLAAADAAGDLDGVEDELFRFGRIVGGDRELNRILSERRSSVEGRRALLDELLTGKVGDVTAQLVRNVLTGPYMGSAEDAVARLSEVASRRRGRSVARVTAAVSLTAAQEQRLTATLTRIYGRPVGLQVTVDPDVLGGLVVQVGDEVIDGSIAHRLDAAERRLAG